MVSTDVLKYLMIQPNSSTFWFSPVIENTPTPRGLRGSPENGYLKVAEPPESEEEQGAGGFKPAPSQCESHSASYLALVAYVVVKTLEHFERLSGDKSIGKFRQLSEELQDDEPELCAQLDERVDHVELMRDGWVYTEHFILPEICLKLKTQSSFQEKAELHLQDITRTNHHEKALQLMCRYALAQ